MIRNFAYQVLSNDGVLDASSNVQNIIKLIDNDFNGYLFEGIVFIRESQTLNIRANIESCEDYDCFEDGDNIKVVKAIRGIKRSKILGNKNYLSINGDTLNIGKGIYIGYKDENEVGINPLDSYLVVRESDVANEVAFENTSANWDYIINGESNNG